MKMFILAFELLVNRASWQTSFIWFINTNIVQFEHFSHIYLFNAKLFFLFIRLRKKITYLAVHSLFSLMNFCWSIAHFTHHSVISSLVYIFLFYIFLAPLSSFAVYLKFFPSDVRVGSSSLHAFVCRNKVRIIFCSHCN